MFDVRWTDEAIVELSRIWMHAHPEDRDLITAAINDIDRTLGTSAETAGESRSDNIRLLIVRSIAVQYCVWQDEREAQVAQVWRMTGEPNS